MSSRPDPVFAGRVNEKSELVLIAPYDYARHKRTLVGKDVEVVLRPKRQRRSLKANAYYWAAVIGTIAPDLGYSSDECHEALAWRFLQIGEADAKLPKRRSTSDLTSHEFEDYVSQVKQFAAQELGIYVPEPNEVDL